MARQNQNAPWLVQGWAMVYANGCGIAGNFAKGEFYAVGIGPNGMRWGNLDTSWCVVLGQRFQRPNNTACQAGEVSIPFQRFQVTDEQFVWTLNFTGNAGSRPIGRPVDIGTPTQIGR